MAERPPSTAVTIGAPSGVLVATSPRVVLSPRVALAAILALSFVVYAALAHATPAPRVFLDELTYLDAAASLASGDGLAARDGSYGFALLYPVILSPLLAAFDREAAYELIKVLNALLFALAVIPIYLLARRVLAPWSSVAAATLSIVIPSAMYVSVVMTESLAYLAACWALYAIVLAVERPSVGRQLGALAAIGLAYLARPQFLVLYAAYVLALVGALALTRTLPGRLRELSGFWPTLAAGAAGLAALVLRPLVGGRSPSESFGEYSGLWRVYSPLDVGTYFLYELANLELYLAVVPVVVAPAVVAALVRRARLGDRRQAAFVSVFLAVNACLIGLVAAFDSIEFRYLHDRYLFYVVPLWLVVAFVWLSADVRTSRASLAAGLGLAVTCAVLPLASMYEHTGGWHFNALGSSLPRSVSDAVDSVALARLVLAAGAVGLALVAFRLRSRAAPVVVMALALAFAVNAAAAWGTAANPPQTDVFASGSSDRRWVDASVPAGVSVTALYVSCRTLAPSERLELTSNSFLLTEFFNSSIGKTVPIEEGPAGATLSRGGGVVEPSGDLLVADYVLAQPGLNLLGRRVAQGTRARLTLWRIRGPVVVERVRSTAQLRAAACGAD